MLEEVLFKRGKLANLPAEKDPGTFYVIEDAKTIQLGDMVIQDTDDVQAELKEIIDANELATTKKINDLAEQMVNASALTRVEEMIPVSTSQLTNDSGFLTVKDLPSDLTEYVTEEELTAKGYTTTTYVNEKIADLVGGAPWTLDTLEELADALKDNKDIVTLLEESIATKQDKIDDLATIRSNAEKGASTYTKEEIDSKGYLTNIPSEYVTNSELEGKGYLTQHQDISGKQDVITDLDVIRNGASLGATALQSVPSEYVTESELSQKGYLTEHQDISGKQDIILDLDAIRSGASLGATALQSIPSEYVTESELNAKNYAIKSDLDNFVLVEEFTSLAETVDSKADLSVLSGYSTTNHNHNEKYYTKGQVDEMWAWLILDDAVSTPSISSDNTIILPDDSESGVYTFKYEDMNETPIENYDDIGKLTI